MLGPRLFNIYVNDLFLIMYSTEIANYADDNTPYVVEVHGLAVDMYKVQNGFAVEMYKVQNGFAVEMYKVQNGFAVEMYKVQNGFAVEM